MSTPADQLDDITVQSSSLKPKGTANTTQFGRRFSLIVADSRGQGLELGTFRCVFFIQRGDQQSPNSANVRVYNLNNDTANSLAGNEFVQLVIQAGYSTNFGLIFRGTIVQTRIGRESQTDSYVDFTAADGDEAYSFSTMSLSLAAGTNSPSNAVQKMLQAMAAYGVAQDDSRIAADIKASTSALPRGSVYHGLARDKLRVFAAENNCLWNITDGRLVVQPLDEPVPGAEILVSPETGLIGIPEQTQNGIALTTLLNPSIRIGQAIRIKSTINQYAYGLGIEDLKSRYALQMQNKLNSDGLYYCMRADHHGDTRGNDFYTEVIALSIDATVFKIDQTTTFPTPFIPPRVGS